MSIEKVSYRWGSQRGIKSGDTRARTSIGPFVVEMAATAYTDGNCWFGRYGSGCLCGHYDTEQDAVNAAHAANLSDGCVEDRDLAQRRAEHMAKLRRDGMNVGEAYRAAKEVL